MEKKNRNKMIKLVLAICIIIAVVLVSMFLEHWYDVFLPNSKILTLRAFWPQLITLGDSEAMLGLGVLYSLFRGLGFRYICILLYLLYYHSFHRGDIYVSNVAIRYSEVYF